MLDPGSGVGGSGEKPARGRAPPADAEFYTNWAKENAKDAIKNANTALGQLLTLSTALLGGLIAFWVNMPFGGLYKGIALVCLLATVLTCLFSAMPVAGRFDPANAADVRRHMEDLFKSKLRRLFLAKYALVTCLVALAIGVIVSSAGLSGADGNQDAQHGTTGTAPHRGAD